MAAGKTYSQKYRFLSIDRTTSAISPDSAFEFNESDVWNNGNSLNRSSSPEYRKTFSNSRYAKKAAKRTSSETGDLGGSIALSAASSLPVNVPDWSKILRNDYNRDDRWRQSDSYADFDDDESYGDRENRIPPHEFLAQQMARTRIASFSVHEGIGRTLKGRDLSRVRNAIWEKTGFED